MKKVLIITYYWPPSGGPGVQRVLKFAKYLPEYGWEPIILTVKKGVYTAVDPSLSNDIPENIRVFKTICPEPDALYRRFTGSGNKTTAIGVLAKKDLSFKQKIAHNIRLNYFIPDAKKFWRPFAVNTGKKIIRQYKPDLIFSSSPPPTTHLIAMDLAEWSGLKWVADFRDPWSRIHYYAGKRSAKAQEKDKKLERQVLEKCNQAMTVSKPFTGLLETKNPEKIKVIYNGFDEQDFSQQPEIKEQKFRITYIGGLNPNRYYRNFFAELKRIFTEKKDLAEKTELAFAGSIEKNIQNELEDIFKEHPGILKFYGYLPHGEAIELMKNSPLLLLFTEKVSHYQGHLPGKLFEYLASGQKIIGVGLTDGEAAKILKQTGQGTIISQDQSPGKLVMEHYKQWTEKSVEKPDWNSIRQYSRKNLTSQLAAIFDDLSSQEPST